MELTGRVAVVTGGSTGIGLATSRRLQKEGAKTVDWSIEDNADVNCDVTDAASVDAALAWTIENVGVPSVLVTSAGVGHSGPTLDLTMESWDHVVDINMRGTFLSARAVTRAMIEHDLDGSMVFVASINGALADPQTMLYSISKAAVYQMAKVFASEFGPNHIRYNAIGPGPTETAMLAPALASDAYRQTVIDTTPLREVGTPDHIADAIVGTLKMDWVTGQGFFADGGTTLVTPRAAARNKLMAAHYES